MIIDLTHLIVQGLPPYPGDSETELVQTKSITSDFHNNHQLKISMHTGTHIDGPMHFLDNSQYLNDFPLDTFIGEGCLINVYKEKVIDYRAEYEQQIKENQIVLLYTGHSECFGTSEYFSNYPVMTSRFAELLIRKRVKMIGMDTPSPDKVPFEIHKALFKSNILLIENLTNLKELLHAERFEVMALPLNIKADSSIARVIARVK